MCLRNGDDSKDGSETVKDVPVCNGYSESNSVCKTEQLPIVADLVLLLNTVDKTTRDAMLCFCNGILSNVNYTNIRSKILINFDYNSTEHITSNSEAIARITEIFKSDTVIDPLSLSEIDEILSSTFEEKTNTNRHAIVLSDNYCNDTEEYDKTINNGVSVIDITIATGKCQQEVSEQLNKPCVFQYRINKTEELPGVLSELQYGVCNDTLYQSAVCKAPLDTTTPYTRDVWTETTEITSKSVNVGLVSGSVVGAFFIALIVIVMLGMCQCKKKRNDKKDKKNTFHEYSCVDQSVFSKESYGDPFESVASVDNKRNEPLPAEFNMESHVYNILHKKEEEVDSDETGNEYHVAKNTSGISDAHRNSAYDHVETRGIMMEIDTNVAGNEYHVAKITSGISDVLPNSTYEHVATRGIIDPNDSGLNETKF